MAAGNFGRATNCVGETALINDPTSCLLIRFSPKTNTPLFELSDPLLFKKFVDFIKDARIVGMLIRLG